MCLFADCHIFPCKKIITRYSAVKRPHTIKRQLFIALNTCASHKTFFIFLTVLDNIRCKGERPFVNYLGGATAKLIVQSYTIFCDNKKVFELERNRIRFDWSLSQKHNA